MKKKTYFPIIDLKTKKNEFLWIPRLLIFFVSYFFFYLLFSILISGNVNQMYTFFIFYLLNLMIMSFFFLFSFKQLLINGILMIIYSLICLIYWSNINSFKYYIILIILISSILLIIIYLLSKKSSNKNIKKRNYKIYKLRSLLLIFPIFIINVIINQTIANTGYTANGPSMTPTIQEKSILLIDLLAYIWQKPKRGDVISITLEGNEYSIVKRIIGLPGETIEWKDYNIYINGNLLYEPYQFDSFTKTYKLTNQFDTVKLKEDEYFVMGDNRSRSKDSREVGPIKRENIKGKVFYIHNLHE